MTDIIISTSFGGYGFSDEAHLLYAKKKNIKVYPQPKANGLIGTVFWKVPEREWENQDNWSELTLKERQASNKRYDKKTLRLRELPRTDPTLIEVVRELGDKANTRFSHLVVVTIPDDVEWIIQEYDGSEHIAEKHRVWYE